MANYAMSDYRITGSEADLDALYTLMTATAMEKENGNWVGYLVMTLNDGQIPDHLYVRGWWDSLEREEGNIYFHQESAWEPLYEAWDFIASKFKTLSVYFMGEEPGCEVFLKRDHPTEHWFSDNYYVDMCTPDEDYHHEYFETLDEALRYVERVTETNIITVEDLEALNSAWQEESDDAYVYLHEYTEV